MIKIVFLGTTSSIPTRTRNLPSVFLMYEGERMLFDCGEGTQRQLMTKNLKFMKINDVFISHWHADHFAGLLPLIQTMALEHRKEPLRIYGPKETKKFITQLLSIGYFYRSFPVIVKDLDEGQVVEGDGYKVIPFKTKHRIPSLGYVFQEDDKINANMQKAKKYGLKTGPMIGKLKAGKTIEFKGKKIKPSEILEITPGRKVVYTGDTAYTENTIKFSKNADVLIHDSTFGEEFVEKAGDFRHGTTKAAAEIAVKANVKKLVLTHISRRYQDKNTSPKELEREAKKVFKNTVLAEDFMQIIIK